MADDSDIVTFKIPHSDGQNEDDRSQNRDSLEMVRKTDEICDAILDAVERRMSRLEKHMFERLSELERKFETRNRGFSSPVPNVGFDDKLQPSLLERENVDKNENRNFRSLSSPSYAFPHIQNERSVVLDVKMKPQLFDGSGDLEERLSQFEILAESNNWDCCRKA